MAAHVVHCRTARSLLTQAATTLLMVEVLDARKRDAVVVLDHRANAIPMVEAYCVLIRIVLLGLRPRGAQCAQKKSVISWLLQMENVFYTEDGVTARNQDARSASSYVANVWNTASVIFLKVINLPSDSEKLRSSPMG
ncbi:hypothetical protein JG688_00003467 [Phytophthora aleatoria]|uniref:Uncharacterized protein n=1 Tax=Phytophthora aleatoria TaxID=2496075 RepID=A0A8J5J4K8_9STRA|nr:hypothetical protein JG688_00003467 [Phytophthora aleatoria]